MVVWLSVLLCVLSDRIACVAVVVVCIVYSWPLPGGAERGLSHTRYLIPRTGPLLWLGMYGTFGDSR